MDFFRNIFALRDGERLGTTTPLPGSFPSSPTTSPHESSNTIAGDSNQSAENTAKYTLTNLVLFIFRLPLVLLYYFMRTCISGLSSLRFFNRLGSFYHSNNKFISDSEAELKSLLEALSSDYEAVTPNSYTFNSLYDKDNGDVYKRQLKIEDHLSFISERLARKPLNYE